MRLLILAIFLMTAVTDLYNQNLAIGLRFGDVRIYSREDFQGFDPSSAPYYLYSSFAINTDGSILYQNKHGLQYFARLGLYRYGFYRESNLVEKTADDYLPGDISRITESTVRLSFGVQRNEKLFKQLNFVYGGEIQSSFVIKQTDVAEINYHDLDGNFLYAWHGKFDGPSTYGFKPSLLCGLQIPIFKKMLFTFDFSYGLRADFYTGNEQRHYTVYDQNFEIVEQGTLDNHQRYHNVVDEMSYSFGLFYQIDLKSKKQQLP